MQISEICMYLATNTYMEYRHQTCDLSNIQYIVNIHINSISFYNRRTLTRDVFQLHIEANH
jgi:hypothetical protein